MVKIILDEYKIHFIINGLHKIWSLKSKITIPLNQIKTVRINNTEMTKPKGWRLPGTYIPGIIAAGTYRLGKKKIFWDVSDFKKSIIVELHQGKYQYLVIEVNDPENTVKKINAVIER